MGWGTYGGDCTLAGLRACAGDWGQLGQAGRPLAEMLSHGLWHSWLKGGKGLDCWARLFYANFAEISVSRRSKAACVRCCGDGILRDLGISTNQLIRSGALWIELRS